MAAAACCCLPAAAAVVGLLLLLSAERRPAAGAGGGRAARRSARCGRRCSSGAPLPCCAARLPGGARGTSRGRHALAMDVRSACNRERLQQGAGRAGLGGRVQALRRRQATDARRAMMRSTQGLAPIVQAGAGKGRRRQCRAALQRRLCMRRCCCCFRCSAPCQAAFRPSHARPYVPAA